jgi:hypothetical protein
VWKIPYTNLSLLSNSKFDTKLNQSANGFSKLTTNNVKHERIFAHQLRRILVLSHQKWLHSSESIKFHRCFACAARAKSGAPISAPLMMCLWVGDAAKKRLDGWWEGVTLNCYSSPITADSPPLCESGEPGLTFWGCSADNTKAPPHYMCLKRRQIRGFDFAPSTFLITNLPTTLKWQNRAWFLLCE